MHSTISLLRAKVGYYLLIHTYAVKNTAVILPAEATPLPDKKLFEMVDIASPICPAR